MTMTDTMRRGPVKKERPAPVARTAIYRNAAGHDLGTVDLEPTVFGLEPNLAVLHQVVTAQLAAARSGTQSTKTRAEVRGGGAKPFNQKGTGRARQGSSRSPSQSGGGVALGPKPRSYRQHTPKKMVRLALLSALSDRAIIQRVCVIDDWKIAEPKTKDAATILRKLKLNGTVLIVLDNDELVVERSFANLPLAQTTSFAELSAHDVLRADWILFSERTLPKSSDDFSGTHGAGDELDEAVGEIEVDETPAPKAAPKAAAKATAKPAAKAKPAKVAPDVAAEPRPRLPTAQRRPRTPHRPMRPSPWPSPRARRTRPMRDAMSVLIRPVVSEKSYGLMDKNVYTFIVDPGATKIDVRHAVEQAFGVRVTDVNTLNRKGKATRNRRTNVKGRRPNSKRAIVTLHPDDSIDLFDR